MWAEITCPFPNFNGATDDKIRPVFFQVSLDSNDSVTFVDEIMLFTCKSVEGNNLSIPKLKWSHHWSLGMDK